MFGATNAEIRALAAANPIFSMDTAHEPADYERWIPHKGQQIRFLASPAFEVLFGGAAGPGKSDCLLLEPLRQIENPRFNGILLRRTFNRLEAADGLIARSRRWYPIFGGDYNAGKHVWTFPSGAHIYFGHMQNEGDEQQYQGAQFSYIGFDELTEFLESQYMFMFSRCRADRNSGLRTYIRAATNPGGIGHEWVKKRFVTSAIVNAIRWFAQVENPLTKLREDTRVARIYPDCKSRSFIPARFFDNPSLSLEYLGTLKALTDPVEVARLVGGDWDALNLDGRVYPNWSYRNITLNAEYRPEWGDVFWSVDDGYQNPRCILFCQHKPDGSINVFDERYASHELAGVAIKAALEQGPHLGREWPRPELVYYDPSAAQFAAECWEWDLNTAPADNRVSEGIKATRDFILDDKGVISLEVHPRCVNLIDTVPKYRLDLNKVVVAGSGDPPPIKENDHAPDALRYFVMTHAVALPRSPGTGRR